MAKKKATKKTAKKAAKRTKKQVTKKKAAKKTAKTKGAATKTTKKKLTAKTARKKTAKAAAKKTTKKKTVKQAASSAGSSTSGFPSTGQLAPDFELMDGSGKAHRLSDYRGRKVVLYFYPKDDTPGCTKEACGFRDTLTEFAKRNAQILGVSPDKVESHEKFARKFSLNFPLLADQDRAVAEHYGAYGEKKLYGKVTLGIKRTTFVIDEQGRLEKIFPNVKADGHEAQVLAYLDQ